MSELKTELKIISLYSYHKSQLCNEINMLSGKEREDQKSSIQKFYELFSRQHLLKKLPACTSIFDHIHIFYGPQNILLFEYVNSQ